MSNEKKFAKDAENRQEHDHIMDILLEIKQDVGYTRGKMDSMETTNSDWWSRFIALMACAIAWMKGV